MLDGGGSCCRRVDGDEGSFGKDVVKTTAYKVRPRTALLLETVEDDAEREG